MSDRECLARAMYFESNRSSDDGLLAVGTVVMNRVSSPRFPHTICGVVGQPGQFANGVLSLPMNPREQAHVGRIADAILAGARHPGVGKAKYFHTAGLRFPYSNMHYVLVAGGNAFYEKVALGHAASGWNQPNADTVNDSKNVERAFREKPVSTFSQHALTPQATPPSMSAMLPPVSINSIY